MLQKLNLNIFLGTVLAADTRQKVGAGAIGASLLFLWVKQDYVSNEWHPGENLNKIGNILLLFAFHHLLSIDNLPHNMHTQKS